MLVFWILLLACWGSFLNFLAYRLVHDISFGHARSICPSCKYQIAWFDLFPIISWLILRGKCRNCILPISIIYPIIELATILVGLGLIYLIHPSYFLSSFILISALLITIRTDLETMLISRFTTLFLIPVAFIFSLTYFGHEPLLSVTISESIKGTVFGYLLLFLINKTFLFLTKKNGLGEGDMELLAMIGAFTGIIGAWVSLMLGSIMGSIIGILMIYQQRQNLQFDTKIPFGPFLAISAIIYVLFQNQLLTLLFN